jgi:DNA-binding LytR/AlgR family response regulator
MVRRASVAGLRVLAVDDELPALDDLAYLLRADPRIADVGTARDGAAALRCLDRALAEDRPVDAVFLDIRMPGLDGIVLGRLLSQFACSSRYGRNGSPRPSAVSRRAAADPSRRPPPSRSPSRSSWPG